MDAHPHADAYSEATDADRALRLTLLYHPNVRRVGAHAALDALADGGEVELARDILGFTPAPGDGVTPADGGATLGDPFISSLPICLRGCDHGGVSIARNDSRTRVRAGDVEIDDIHEVRADALDEGVVLELSERIVLLLHRVPALPPPPADLPDFDLTGHSVVLDQLRRRLWLALESGAPVLLRGGAGTGKERIARAAHKTLFGDARPFVHADLGAMPPSLARAELFGAATDTARHQPGHVQKAHGGTLFVDRVHRAPSEVQVLLLRLVETGAIDAIGGHASTPSEKIDVRLIAATREMTTERDDVLLQHLTAHEIRLPTLRERRDDIPMLLLHFLRVILEGAGQADRLRLPTPSASPWLPARVVARLCRYNWPGNVEELRSVARRLMVRSRGLPNVEIDPELDETLRADGGGEGHSVLSARYLDPGHHATPLPDQLDRLRDDEGRIKERDLWEALKNRLRGKK
ncbi:MAG: sigma 54-interacting transcriptional regulator [Acidobacteriota bacterium]